MSSPTSGSSSVAEPARDGAGLLQLVPRYGAYAVVLLTALLAAEAPRLSTRVNTPWTVAVLQPDSGYSDLDDAYYPAARIIREAPERLYDPGAYGVDAVLGFVNLPIVAWVFAPLAEFPLALAGDLFLAINVVVAIACLLLLLDRLGPAPRSAQWALTIAFASSGPLIRALNLGQTTPLVLLLLIITERCLWRGRDAAAGALLALVLLVKVPPLLLLPYFAYRRRWRLLAACGAVLAIVAAASLALYGADLHRVYVDHVFASHVGRAFAAHNSQSLGSVVARLFTDAPLWSWQSIVLPGAGAIVYAASVAALLGALAWSLRAPAAGPPHCVTVLEAAAVLVASLLVMPVYWSHYGVWLLPVAAVVLACGRPTRALVLTVAAAVVLVNVPIPPRWILESFDREAWFRLLISHQALGTLLLFGACVRRRSNLA